MTNALFDINADGNDQGFTATNGLVLTFKLRDDPAPGVNRVLFQVFDPGLFNAALGIAANPPRSSCDAPTLTLDNGAGSTGQAVSPVVKTGVVTTSAPAAGIHSYIVRCVVNGGKSAGPSGKPVPDPELIHERIVAIPNGFGTRKPITTETTQFEDDGWGQVMCDLVDNEGSAAVDYKDSVRAATTAPLPANTRIGNVITGDVNGALTPIDTVDLNVGDPFLDKDAVLGANRGIYVLDVKGDGSNPFSATRRGDFDSDFEVTSMCVIPVEEGAENGPNGISNFQLVTPDDITINVTSLTFQAFGAPGGAEIVADVATLVALNVGAREAGSQAEVQSFADQAVLRDDATLKAAGDALGVGNVQLMVPIPADGNKVWERRNLGSAKWRERTVWFVNGDTGNDENTGLLTGTALKTLAEWERRIGPNPRLPVVPTITLDGTVDLVLRLSGAIGPGGSAVNFVGTSTVESSGTTTSATDLDNSIKQAQVIEATGIQSGDADEILMTSGPASGEKTWGLAALTADSLRTMPFIGTPGSTPTPAGGDTFDIRTKTVLQIEVLELRGGNTPNVIFTDIDVKFGGGSVVRAPDCVGIRFKNCKVAESLLLGTSTLMLFDGCLIDNVTFGGPFCKLKDCGFRGESVFLDGRIQFSGRCGSEETLGRKMDPKAGGLTVDTDKLGGGCIFTMDGDNGTEELGIYNPTAVSGASGAGSVGWWVNESDVGYVDDNFDLWGPDASEAGPAFGIACMGKIFWNPENSAGPNTTIRLSGTTADVRLGSVNRSLAALAGTNGDADVDTGAIFQPRQTAV